MTESAAAKAAREIINTPKRAGSDSVRETDRRYEQEVKEGRWHRGV